MRKPKMPAEILRFFQQTGAIGGKSRARRYSKEQLSEWAKLGGRPKGSGKKQKAKERRNG